MGWILIIATGVVFGLGAVLLVKAGNPGNYGFCAACHLRDIAGALGLHQVATLQYARPEIIGFVLGSFSLAMISGEFRPRGGSRPLVRFVLGALMVIGALVFLGCPLRGILRLAGGDLNGLTGLAGFACGIAAGIVFLKGGYNLGRAQAYSGGTGRYAGYLAAAAALVLLVGVATQAAWLNFSAKGPGAQHAPIFFSLVAGLLAGGLAWRTRMCLSGGLRDFLLVRDTYLLKIYAVIFAAALLGNLAFGTFKLGFDAQPLAHTAHLWNFLGLFLTGIAAVLAGGCPLRQLIQAGEGNTDAMFTALGMLAGAGVSHGLNAAASAAGVTAAGQVAVIVGIAAAALIGYVFRETITVAAEV
ncbi:MAG TPA: YedE family putative selenium transporter [Negativicutes bacterium]|nr:YedE family putative selenium transporter [Negativicutes bacterium]